MSMGGLGESGQEFAEEGNRSSLALAVAFSTRATRSGGIEGS